MDSQPFQEPELSLRPPAVNVNPSATLRRLSFGGSATYAAAGRSWQGIPGIERAANGRLWAVWYSGGNGEGPANYVLAVTSDDDGRSWSQPRVVIDPPGRVRAFDPVLWRDPQERLWLFWAQSYGHFDGRAGVWCLRTREPESDRPSWSEPRRICHGVMMNKPLVLSTGLWLLPAAVWDAKPPRLPELQAQRRSNVICSLDCGRTWTLRGGADVPERTFDEHMIVERRDGSLWMLVRTRYGIGQSVSQDQGQTWSAGRPSDIAGPDSRFHIRRLRCGDLLLINHRGFTGRSHLTASLSQDDGRSFSAHLLLDERPRVSYPDAVEADDGRIFAIYDRDRSGEGEILMAVFRPQDVLAGRCVCPDARLRCLVSRIGKNRDSHPF